MKALSGTVREAIYEKFGKAISDEYYRSVHKEIVKIHDILQSISMRLKTIRSNKNISKNDNEFIQNGVENLLESYYRYIERSDTFIRVKLTENNFPIGFSKGRNFKSLTDLRGATTHNFAPEYTYEKIDNSLHKCSCNCAYDDKTIEYYHGDCIDIIIQVDNLKHNNKPEYKIDDVIDMIQDDMSFSLTKLLNRINEK